MRRGEAERAAPRYRRTRGPGRVFPARLCRAAIALLATLTVVPPSAAQDRATPLPPAAAVLVEGPPGVPRATLDTTRERAVRIVARIAKALPGTPTRPFHIVLDPSVASLAPATRDHLHAGTPGFALLGHDELHIVLSELGTGPNGLDTVLAHEIAHVLLDQYAGPNAPNVPRWFHEGLAQVLSGDTYLGAREEDIVFAASVDRLPRLSTLRRTFPSDPVDRRSAYALSFSFVGYLIRNLGMDTVVRAARESHPIHGYSFGFGRETGQSFAVWEDRWKHYLLHESGAESRVHFNNCFSYLMIPAIVLLALAVSRRLDREARIRARLEAADSEPDADSDGDPGSDDDPAPTSARSDLDP